jgi:hypothetical protein
LALHYLRPLLRQGVFDSPNTNLSSFIVLCLSISFRPIARGLTA